MAERRMFSQKITEADGFTTLPPTTQCLYFHLCMNADDDGFSNKIRNAMFNAHADQHDFEMLVQKRFILPFDSGVIVIKHWRMHNLIRTDRYHETDYLEEKSTLLLKDNGVYTDKPFTDNQVTTIGIPSDNQMETEVRLGKDSIGKERIGKDNIIGSEPKKDSEQMEIIYADVPKIPLNNGSEWCMPLDLFNEYKNLYPAVDVAYELGKMRMWSLSNPTKKKTPKGVSRFINTWLSKAQDKGGKVPNTTNFEDIH